MDMLALLLSVSVMATILAGAFALYAGAAVSTQIRGRLEGALSGTSVVEGSSAVGALRETHSVVGFLRGFMSGGWTGRMQENLERADSQLQPVDFVALRVAFAGIGFIVPFILLAGLYGVLAGLPAAIVGFQLPQFWIDRRREKRAKKLEEQLPETLTLVANSLKAGFGLLQSLNLAAEQLEHPISTELTQTIHEMSVGSSADEALLALSERSDSYDLDLVVTAILVQRSVGGNLSEILDNVAETMRERIRIRGEIVTLTAQQSLTGMVIGLLPFFVGGMFMVISPEYISVLFTETMGRIMLASAIVLETIGIMVIRRILAIEV